MPRAVTTFGPHGCQPLADYIARQRWTYVLLADELGVSERHVRNVANGWTRPNCVLRKLLPRLMDATLDDLFTGSAIAEDFATRPKRKAHAS